MALFNGFQFNGMKATKAEDIPPEMILGPGGPVTKQGGTITDIAGDVQQSIIEQAGNVQQSIIEQAGNVQQDIIKGWGEVEKNPVVDFVQKNNVVSLITKPEESTIIKTVKDTAGDVQQDIIAWGGDVQQSILDGYDNIAKWGGKNWPILAAAGGALLLILLKK